MYNIKEYDLGMSMKTSNHYNKYLKQFLVKSSLGTKRFGSVINSAPEVAKIVMDDIKVETKNEQEYLNMHMTESSILTSEDSNSTSEDSDSTSELVGKFPWIYRKEKRLSKSVRDMQTALWKDIQDNLKRSSHISKKFNDESLYHNENKQKLQKISDQLEREHMKMEIQKLKMRNKSLNDKSNIYAMKTKRDNYEKVKVHKWGKTIEAISTTSRNERKKQKKQKPTFTSPSQNDNSTPNSRLFTILGARNLSLSYRTTKPPRILVRFPKSQHQNTRYRTRTLELTNPKNIAKILYYNCGYMNETGM